MTEPKSASESNATGRFRADIMRLEPSSIDIKLMIDGEMHLLQWRRYMFWDTVLVDGRAQHKSTGLWGREKVFGLLFGADENRNGGERMLLVVDPDSNDWTGMAEKAAGVRLETSEGPLVAHGTLDPKALEQPATLSDWMKKSLGMKW